MPKQYTKPCRECPFRRVAPRGYLGGNDPKDFAILANHEGNFQCHLTMGKPSPAQCAGRATMWANQCKKSRDSSVPELQPDREHVFNYIGEFMKHHEIALTPLQIMGADDIDSPSS